jgi:hypothetical protein
LAQRQGLTSGALGDLGETLSDYIRSLAYTKKNKYRPTIKLIELRIRNLARLANYYANCLRDPEFSIFIKDWQKWDAFEKRDYIEKYNNYKISSKINKMLNIDATALTFFFDHHDSFSVSKGSTNEELAKEFEAFANRIRTKKALKAYIESLEYETVG